MRHRSAFCSRGRETLVLTTFMSGMSNFRSRPQLTLQSHKILEARWVSLAKIGECVMYPGSQEAVPLLLQAFSESTQ
jgi:hypothetical protein